MIIYQFLFKIFSLILYQYLMIASLTKKKKWSIYHEKSNAIYLSIDIFNLKTLSKGQVRERETPKRRRFISILTGRFCFPPKRAKRERRSLSLSQKTKSIISLKNSDSQEKNARGKVGPRQPLEEGSGSDQGPGQRRQLRLLGGGVLAPGHGFEPPGPGGPPALLLRSEGFEHYRCFNPCGTLLNGTLGSVSSWDEWKEKTLKWCKLTSHPKHLLGVNSSCFKEWMWRWFVLLLNTKVRIHPTEEIEGWVTLLLASGNFFTKCGMLSIS